MKHTPDHRVEVIDGKAYCLNCMDLQTRKVRMIEFMHLVSHPELYSEEQSKRVQEKYKEALR